MSLDQQRVQAAEPVYEDFEPPSEWVHDESSDTLILMLPGFKKEQLKVQIASTRILRLSGERQMSENKWRQFRKEFAIPPESDTSGVTAKFDNGMLSIKLPKHITPIKTTQPPPIIQQPAPKNNPQQPTPNAQPIQQNPVDKSSSQPTKTQNTTKPPPPPPTPPIAPYQKEPKLVEESQKKQKLVEKTAEAYKDEKTKAVAAVAAPTRVTPLEKPKKEVDDSVKKPQKEKGKSEATTSRGQGVSEGNIVPKRSHTMELLSRQTQEYKKAVSGLVEEVKKQKKMVNFSVLITLVLVFGFYVKNAIKSSLGGPKIEEL